MTIAYNFFTTIPAMRVLCTFVVFHGALCCSLQVGAKSPNIIMVYIDDLGWGDFSCFGNTEAQTPNVDRLATEGIRFSQFYVNSPICSPSRCALATGQHPQRWRITSFLLATPAGSKDNANGRTIARPCCSQPRLETTMRIRRHPTTAF